MDILIVLMFISLVLVAAAVLLFMHAARNRDMQRAEQLSLLPLEEEEDGKSRHCF